VKSLQSHTIAPAKCRREWSEYDALLAIKPELSERGDVLPFFKKRHDLSLLICSYFPEIKKPNCLAHEYAIDGDFIVDLIVGDATVNRFVLIEFENGRPDSIFHKKSNKSTSDWAQRFEGAYSQIVDWLWKLEDKRSTSDFVSTFGNRRAKFQALVVIGKNMNLSDREKDRLDWRMNRTLIDSNRVSSVSFDQLRDDMDHWLRTYDQV
jgi:hypothetical protein